MFSCCFRWNIRWKMAQFHLFFHVFCFKKVEEKVECTFSLIYKVKRDASLRHPFKIQIQKALLFAFALAVHPALMVVLAAVFFRCHACGLLEYLDEVGLGGESQVVCDGQGGLVQVS